MPACTRSESKNRRKMLPGKVQLEAGRVGVEIMEVLDESDTRQGEMGWRFASPK